METILTGLQRTAVGHQGLADTLPIRNGNLLLPSDPYNATDSGYLTYKEWNLALEAPISASIKIMRIPYL